MSGAVRVLNTSSPASNPNTSSQNGHNMDVNNKPQQVQPPSFDSTAIIFDWDDTLLASSWLASEGLRLDFPPQVPVEAMGQLKILESLVIQVLERALQFGDVHVVTNAETGWVELSAQRFMPGVVPYLSKLKIISARSTYERIYPEQPSLWKIAAFRKQMSLAFRNRMETDGLMDETLHIISFGDSVHERDALRVITQELANSYAKSVKFVERPTMEQLQRQLELVNSCFDYIIAHNGELDLMLNIQLLYN